MANNMLNLELLANRRARRNRNNAIRAGVFNDYLNPKQQRTVPLEYQPNANVVGRGTMSALPPTMTMRAGEVLTDYLSGLRKVFPEANPIGQAIEDFMLQPSEEMAAQMVEGNPYAVFDTRAGQQLINPALPEAVGLAPVGAIAKTPGLVAPAAIYAAGRGAEGLLGITDAIKKAQAEAPGLVEGLLTAGMGRDPRANIMGVLGDFSTPPETTLIQMSSEALPSTGLLDGRIIKQMPIEQQYQFEREVQDIVGTRIEDYLGLVKMEEVIAPSHYEGHTGASLQTLYQAETELDDLGNVRLTPDFKRKMLEAAVARGYLQDQDAVTMNYSLPIQSLDESNLAYIDYDRPITNEEMVNFNAILDDIGSKDDTIARVSTPNGIKFLNVGTDNETFQKAMQQLGEKIDSDINLGKNDLADDMSYGYIGGGDYRGGQEAYENIAAKIDDASSGGSSEPWWRTNPEFVSLKEQLKQHREGFLKANPLPQRTIRQIGEESDAFYKQERNTLKLDDYSDRAKDTIASRMYDETLRVLRGGDRTARGWYTDEYDQALSAIAEHTPQLDTPPQKDLFTTLIGLFSDGTELGKNAQLAVRQYNDYLDTGKVNATVPQEGGERTQSFVNNLNKLQDLIDSKGLDGAMEYLNQTSTAKDLTKETGREFGYFAETELPHTMIFGDKLGAFMANLKGHPDYLTMDRWWNRTFNRLRGQMTTQPTSQSVEKFKQLIGKPNAQMRTVKKEAKKYQKQYQEKGYKNGTEIERTANNISKALAGLRDVPLNKSDRKFQTDVAKQVVERLKNETEYTDMNVADLQAIMWFAEKRRMREFGSRSPIAEKTYADVVRDDKGKLFPGLLSD